MGVAIFDPDMFDVIVAAHPLSGFAEGEFVTVEYDEAAYNIVVGTDGVITRSKNLNNTAKVTIKLMQSSKDNDFLSAIWLIGRRTSGGGDIVPLMLKDRNGTTSFAGASAWIEKLPGQSFDKSAKSRDWIFVVDNPLVFLGGTG